MEIVSKEDFVNVSNINNLSPFEMLLLVAEKASEKEEKKLNSKVEDRIDIRMQESCTLPCTHAKHRHSPVGIRLNDNNVDRRRTPKTPPPPVAQPPPPPVALPLPPPANLSEIFWRRIQELGGSNPEFVIKKVITKTDLNKCEARLSMTKSQCKVEFNDRDVPVMVILPDLQICTLNFTIWNTNNCYALNRGWKTFLTTNSLIKVDDIIHIWRFRLPPTSNYLWGFALVKISN